MSRASASASLFVRWMREGRRELSDDDDDDDDEMEARRRRRDDDACVRERGIGARACVVVRGRARCVGRARGKAASACAATRSRRRRDVAALNPVFEWVRALLIVIGRGWGLGNQRARAVDDASHARVRARSRALARDRITCDWFRARARAGCARVGRARA